MATTLLALLDDIASLLDDVSAMTKVAATKTAGVLGDDLALNAQQVSGVTPERELPVVWAVAKGSLVNKAILVPGALAISAVAPWAVTPLLMAGGAYLCYEGFEKIVHSWQARRAPHHHDAPGSESEKDKIKGAIRTDFILSAEIITIALGTVAQESLLTQAGVLAAVALVMTVAVYGLVGGIVKLDDLGFFLARRPRRLPRAIGGAILRAAPWLMKALSIVGTAAMFLVGGGIVVHGIAPLHHALADFGQAATMVGGGVAGIVVGAVLVGVTLLFRPRTQAQA